MEKGQVKFFNPAEGKRFGFVRAESGEEIFFHFGDGAQVALEYGFRGEISPDFVSGKSPVRDPRKGDELAFERRQGRKDKGPKATPWAFASEYNKLAALASRIGRPQYWAEPNFVGFKTESTSGWFPTTYYAYYPASDEAYEAGIHTRKFDTLLLYKQGEVVVTGRTVRWHHGESQLMYGERYNKLEEPVFGILPADAPDGFYFWSGAKWERCEQVLVRATSVSCNSGQSVPAYYRFIGLRTKSGKLVPIPVEDAGSLRSNEFFHIREVKQDESCDLPVVETHVDRGMWFTERERQTWCEPSLAAGIEPRFDAVLNRLDEAKVSKARLNSYNSHFLVTITLPGEETYQVEYSQGYSGYTPGVNMAGPGDPTAWIQRTPNGTFVAAHWRQNEADQRLIALEKRLASAEWAVGPYEERFLAESGGKFYLEWAPPGSCDAYAVFCSHGRQVSRTESAKSERPEQILPILENGLQRYGERPCPFGCEVPFVVKPEMFRNHGGSILQTTWGVPEGMLSVEEVKSRIERRQEETAGYVEIDYVPYHGFHVYRTPDGSERPGILLVYKETAEFVPAPVKVVKTECHLLDSKGRAVAKAGWEKRSSNLYEVVSSTSRSIADLIEAGALDRTLAPLR